MKFEYVIPFVESTTNVLSTMAMVEVTSGTPYRRNEITTYGAVTGVIGMSGANVRGNMILSFDAPAILQIVNNMLSEQYTEISHDIMDAVGELTNMICGGAKRGLADLGLQIEMATPIMLDGKGIEIYQSLEFPVLTIPFKTPAGTFIVESNLAKC